MSRETSISQWNQSFATVQPTHSKGNKPKHPDSDGKGDRFEPASGSSDLSLRILPSTTQDQPRMTHYLQALELSSAENAQPDARNPALGIPLYQSGPPRHSRPSQRRDQSCASCVLGVGRGHYRQEHPLATILWLVALIG